SSLCNCRRRHRVVRRGDATSCGARGPSPRWTVVPSSRDPEAFMIAAEHLPGDGVRGATEIRYIRADEPLDVRAAAPARLLDFHVRLWPLRFRVRCGRAERR